MLLNLRYFLYINHKYLLLKFYPLLYNGRLHACIILFVIQTLDHGVLGSQILYLNVLYSLNKLGAALKKYWKYVFFYCVPFRVGILGIENLYVFQSNKILIYYTNQPVSILHYIVCILIHII